MTANINVETATIAGTSLAVSRVGLGTWAMGGWMWGGTDDDESVKTIHAAVEHGVSLIDTAPAYGFGRSDKFDARNYFNPVGSDKTPVELEQYGGSAGGHIIKDKLFYFGAYEGQMYTVGNSLPGHVPTTASIVGGGGNGCVVITTGDCSISVADATQDLLAQNPSFVVNPLSNYLLGF